MIGVSADDRKLLDDMAVMITFIAQLMDRPAERIVKFICEPDPERAKQIFEDLDVDRNMTFPEAIRQARGRGGFLSVNAIRERMRAKENEG